MFGSIADGMIIGRPDTTTTTHFAACAHTVFTAAVSASDSCMVLAGRSTPWSPGSKPHCGPPTSPKPSEYGVSPTTTMPTAFDGTGADASWLNVTLSCSDLMPCRIVCPGITLVEPPCQVSVQPPA